MIERFRIDQTAWPRSVYDNGFLIHAHDFLGAHRVRFRFRARFRFAEDALHFGPFRRETFVLLFALCDFGGL